MDYKAHHRFADMSARKIRPFATLIRGRPADEALELLRFLPNKSARLLEQVVKSALGNAEARAGNAALNDGSQAALETFLTDGQYTARLEDMRVGTSKLMMQAGPEVQKYATRALSGTEADVLWFTHAAEVHRPLPGNQLAVPGKYPVRVDG